MRDYTDRRFTPPKRVTSPTWGPPPPRKQALSLSWSARRRLSFLLRKQIETIKGTRDINM